MQHLKTRVNNGDELGGSHVGRQVNASVTASVRTFAKKFEFVVYELIDWGFLPHHLRHGAEWVMLADFRVDQNELTMS